MSMFESVVLPCPTCENGVEFEAVLSVNADRRPDLRSEIIDGSFQRNVCSKCEKGFRLDPQLTYLDMGRGQWIAVFPVANLPKWQEFEAKTLTTYNRTFGPEAPAAAREIGEGLKPRLVFGWAALREKLVAADHKLDDVILELAKSALVRGLDPSPLAPGTEIRFVAMDGSEMIFAWIRSADEEIVETFNAPRALYDGIAADLSSWEALREILSEGPFVDLSRILVAAA